MSEQPFEPAPEASQQIARTLDVADRPAQFEVIPNVCLIEDVCRILRISARQFHYLTARRKLSLVEIERWDRKRRFTGESVARVIRMRR